MAALVKPAIDVFCQECQSSIRTEALKCSKCKLHSHLRCSSVAEYQIVFFALRSHRQFVCKTCVRNETGYSEAQKRIEDIINNERSEVESAVSDNQDENQNGTENQVNSEKTPEDGEFYDSVDSTNTLSENIIPTGNPEVDRQNNQRSDQTRILAIDKKMKMKLEQKT